MKLACGFRKKDSPEQISHLGDIHSECQAHATVSPLNGKNCGNSQASLESQHRELEASPSYLRSCLKPERANKQNKTEI